MSGQKDKAMSVVISGMTSRQANQMRAEIGVAKDRIAPNARATCAIGNKDDIKKGLQSANRKLLK